MSIVHCSISGNRIITSTWKCHGLAARALEGKVEVHISLAHGQHFGLRSLILSSLDWGTSELVAGDTTVLVRHADALCLHTTITVCSTSAACLTVNKVKVIPNTRVSRSRNVSQD